MQKSIHAAATRRRSKPPQTETLRPFVQKYQSNQLPLPEACPLADSNEPAEQSAEDSGNPLCATPCCKNS